MMELDWESGELAAGLACYRSQEYFEAHEHWEAVWLRSVEPQKTFLQALIHVTAAFHHLRKGNIAGASSQLGRALSKLGPYPAECCGVHVEALRQSLAAWIKSLAAGEARPQLPVPPI